MSRVKDATGITDADRLWAMERALNHVAGGYVRRVILKPQAHGYKDALGAAVAECRWWGHYGPDGRVRGTGDGLQVEMDDGRCGIIRWQELVSYVRSGAVRTQLTLFDDLALCTSHPGDWEVV